MTLNQFPKFEISKTSLFLFLAKIAINIIGLLSTVYFTRKIGATILGVYFLFLTVNDIVGMFANLGLKAAVTKRISEGKDQGQLLSASFIIQVLLIAFLLVTVIVLKPHIEDYIGASLTFFLIIVIALSQINKLFQAVLRGRKKITKTALLTLLNNVSRTLVSILLLMLGLELYALIYGLLFGYFLSSLLGYLSLRLQFAKPSKHHFRSLLEFAKFGALLGFGGVIYNWVDPLVIGWVLSKADVAIYKVAWKVATFTSILSFAISTTIFPQVSEWHAWSNEKAISRIIPSAIIFSSLIPIGAFSGALMFSGDILEIFGEEFTKGWLVLIILLLESIFLGIRLVFDNILAGMDKLNTYLRVRIISILLNILLSIIFVWKLGIVGVAIATLAGSLVESILAAWSLRQDIYFKLPLLDLLFLFGGSLVMSLMLLPIKNFFGELTIEQLIGLIMVGGFIYFAILMLNRKIRKMAFSLVRSFLPT